MAAHDDRVCLLQLEDHDNMDPNCHDFNVDDFLADDYPNYLMGPDVNLTNLILESDEIFSCVREELLPSAETKEVDTCVTMKSPWHGSDSGVSETLSFVGSPPDPCSASTEVSRTDTAACTDGSGLSSLSHLQTGSELMSFLFSETNQNKTPVVLLDTPKADNDNEENTTPLSSSGRPLRMSSRNKVWNTDFEFFDSDDSNSGEQHQEHRVIKPAARCTKPLGNKNEISAAASRGKAINIIKITKGPGSETTDDDIIQALDNRSKRNAQQAKLNRERKKAYIKSLENDRDHLTKENTKLSLQIESMTERMSTLEAEVVYLKSVLANSSALSGLLKNISKVKEVKLTSSFTCRKRAYENDHSYNLTHGILGGKKLKDSSANVGVCLHVSDGAASLEFCAHCASLAHRTQRCSEAS